MIEHRAKIVDVLTNSETINRVKVLGKDAYPLSNLALVRALAHIVIKHLRLAACWGSQAFQNLYGRSFSRTVRAEEGEDLPFGEGEGNPVDSESVLVFLR